MKCPVCKDSNLLMTDRQGIEIDYCNECRGVWLDRGELDKIIEKSNNANGSERNNSDNRERQSNERSYDNHSDHNDDYKQNNDYKNKNKKGGFLGDLLDF
jgi:Zn-finger nucleic acid-binding protein